MQTIKKALANGRLVLLALVIVITSSGCRPAGPQALLDGERLIHEGKYPEAIERLQVATQYLPKTAQAWNHLGLAYHGAGQPDDARKAYQMALKLDRDLAAARYNLGNLFLEQNQSSNAVAEFTTFTIQQPGSTNGWIKLGYAQIGARQWTAAQKSLAYAYKLAPANPEILNGLGLLSLQRKNTAEAVGYFKAAVQRQPVYAPALLNLAILTHQNIRNLPLALKMYRDYAALTPRPANSLAVEEVARRLDLELHPPPPPKAADQIAHAPKPASIPSAVTNPLAMTTPPALTRPAIPEAPPQRPATRPPESAPAPKAEPVPKPQVSLAEMPPAPKPAPATPPPPKPRPTKPVTPLPTKPVEKPVVVEPEPGVKPAMIAPTPADVVAPAPKPRSVEPRKLVTTKPEPAPPPAPAEPPVVIKPVTAKTETPPPAPTSAVQVAIAKPAAPPVIEREPITAPPPSATTPEKPAEKPGFFQRMNPVRLYHATTDLFRSKPKPTTPLPPSRKQARAQAVTEPPAPVATPLPPAPRVVESAPVPVLVPAPKPKPPPKPATTRYHYLAPAKPEAGDRAQAQAHFLKGIAAQQKKKFTEAIAAYREAIRFDPAFFESYYNLGLVTLETGDLGQALVADEYALALDPDAANARFNLALTLQRAHYPRDAADELEKLLAGHPDHTQAHLMLAGLCAGELADSKRAREHYLSVLRLNPKHPEAATIGYWLRANP